MSVLDKLLVQDSDALAANRDALPDGDGTVIELPADVCSMTESFFVCSFVSVFMTPFFLISFHDADGELFDDGLRYGA